MSILETWIVQITFAAIFFGIGIFNLFQFKKSILPREEFFFVYSYIPFIASLIFLFYTSFSFDSPLILFFMFNVFSFLLIFGANPLYRAIVYKYGPSSNQLKKFTFIYSLGILGFMFFFVLFLLMAQQFQSMWLEEIANLMLAIFPLVITIGTVNYLTKVKLFYWSTFIMNPIAACCLLTPLQLIDFVFFLGQPSLSYTQYLSDKEFPWNAIATVIVLFLYGIVFIPWLQKKLITKERKR